MWKKLSIALVLLSVAFVGISAADNTHSNKSAPHQTVPPGPKPSKAPKTQVPPSSLPSNLKGGVQTVGGVQAVSNGDNDLQEKMQEAEQQMQVKQSIRAKLNQLNQFEAQATNPPPQGKPKTTNQASTQPPR